MGQGISNPLKDNLDTLHKKLMQHHGADYDIVTSTTLTYELFISYITRVNEICYKYKDNDDNVLVLAVKNGTDSSLFWKATVRIACINFNISTKNVGSQKLLNLRQFLQLFRRISYECTGEIVGPSASLSQNLDDSCASNSSPQFPPFAATSIILGDESSSEASGERENANSNVLKILAKVSSESSNGCRPKERDVGSASSEIADGTNLEECSICLERKTDVILPCSHAYCLPCIEQWWEYSQSSRNICVSIDFPDNGVRNCPVCRQSLDDSDDTWVIPEVPDKSLVSELISKSLLHFATN